MTFIQPNKSNSLLNRILVVLIIGVIAGVFGMVALYNETVNLDHNIAAAKAQLDAVGAESTSLSNQVMAALGGIGSTELATKDGLVQDQNPQYFPVNQAWHIASQ
jgi:hypothetical protein